LQQGVLRLPPDAADLDAFFLTNARKGHPVGVVCAPVYTIGDVFQDPQVMARELLVAVEDEQRGLAEERVI
jgi:crotonobetainyl-CoA:carnitine CoA-transferase CaiB-like acyl-CoA transferase